MADYFKNSDQIDTLSTDKHIIGMQYDVIADLSTEPVTVEFFKEHARIDFNTDDTLVATYLVAARIALEQWGQISFGVKTIGLKALSLPTNYKLMYGRVDTVTTTGFTNFGDILKEGGTDVDIQYTTTGIINDTIRVAICRYAAGLYVNRENVTDTKFSSQSLQDEAKRMIMPFINVTFI